MVIHNFQDRLKWSESASHQPFWDAVYRKAFPGLVNHMQCPGDQPTQRMGVDRLVYLNNDRVLRIDEKKRDKVYPDILLEYLSNDKTKAPGWMEKNLVIDYIAYAFMPTQKVYLLDWLTLRRAWVANKGSWLSRHRHVTAKNEGGYTTRSIAVPIPVLQKALNEAQVVSVAVQIIELSA